MATRDNGSTPSAGAELRAWRKREGVTQEQLAARLGCTRVWISYLEGGETSPSLRLSEAIYRETGIRPELWVSRATAPA